ncbi:MAG TPA: TonB-dependent receptor [Bryobacteraceae bacterium]|nr:TonB-dependent receptor [Bryobacteraceae bacterium]
MAQYAQIGGRVTDPSGAVIPGTAIVITSDETGVARNTTSNDEGYYTVPLLLPGKYHLNAQKEGFRQLTRDAIVLQVGDKITLNLAMEVGSAAESVTVTTEVPLLRTEDAQQGLVIDNRRIMELPQYSRDPLAFAQLAPNVNGAANEASYGSDFRVNGGRTNQTEYYLDGQPVTTGYLHNIPASVPSKEALAEFKVVTNGMAAEYGRLSGGAVVLSTRSGTNEFHGSLYEFFKNDTLNANDWNSNRLGRQKGVFHDNVFGFTFGGPVLIPKAYNGRDKTFFFLNYEGTRHVTGSNAYQASVPTDLEKQGDFSQSLVNGVPAQIFDPATGTLVNGQVVRQPFPGERIPQSRFDPLAKIYAAYYPAPNTAPLPGTNNQSNYTYSMTAPSDNNRWTGRLDQNWNSSHSTHFSLSYYDYNYSVPHAFSPMQASTLNTTTSYTTSIDHNWVVNPSTILTLRGGFIRDRVFSGSTVNVDDSSWGLPANVVNLLGGTNNGRVPAITNMAGLTGLGGGSVDDIRDTNYFGSISIQKMHGRHTIKAGYEHRRYYSNEITGGNFEMSTDRSATSFSPSTAAINGAMFAGYLLGVTTWGDGNQLTGPAALQTYHGAYVQDDIKLTRKLTINAGIRWDFEPPRTERFNREVFWDRSYTWNIKPNADWSWSQVEQTMGMTLAQPIWMSQGIHGRAAMMGTPDYPQQTMEPTQPYHFGPRLAAAYQLFPKTVVRVSYGLIWMTKTGSWFMGAARWNVGYGDAARLAQGGTGDGGLTYPLAFSNPMPGGAGYIPRTSDNTALNMSVMGNWWLSETNQFSPGHEHNTQLAIQQELGSGRNTWVVEIAYNGTMGRSLPTWLGVGDNVLPDAYHKIGGLGSNLLVPVPNPFYGQIPAGTARSGKMIPLGQLYQLQPLWSQITTTGDPIGTSNYNSGYVQIEHRFSHGFSFLANYTLSKLMEDTGSIDYNSPGNRYRQAGLGGKDVYGLSTSDSRHKLIFNYSVEIPFGKGKRYLNDTQTFGGKVLDKVLGGWVAAGVTTVRSGHPLSITGSNQLWWTAGQAVNSGQSERPVYVYPRLQYNNDVSGHTALIGSPNYTPYMNRAAFRFAQATPNLLEIGDVPWDLPGLISPWFSQWDFALMKNFTLGKESRYFQLRFEAQNLFNHMNAGNPDGALQDATFGMITGQNGLPRQAMVAAKFYF